MRPTCQLVLRVAKLALPIALLNLRDVMPKFFLDYNYIVNFFLFLLVCLIFFLLVLPSL